MRLTLPKPCDMHVHLREGDLLKLVARFTARHYSRALIMPNLKVAITLPQLLTRYREEILATTSADYPNFEPLMSFEIREDTDPVLIPHFKEVGAVAGKVYPHLLTTNAYHGVRNYHMLWPVFAAMQQYDLVLCFHGEQPGLPLDGRQALIAESVFIEETLLPVAHDFPNLRIVLEHISTQLATQVVPQLSSVVATITAHHLVLNHDHVGGYRMCPNNFCKPSAKMEEDRLALVAAATSGNPKFFFGSDSASHPREGKARLYDCCAGCFTSPMALPLLAHVFDEAGALGQLQAFVHDNARAFYRLTPSAKTIVLKKKLMTIPQEIEGIVPFMAGELLPWSVQ